MFCYVQLPALGVSFSSASVLSNLTCMEMYQRIRHIINVSTHKLCDKRKTHEILSSKMQPVLSLLNQLRLAVLCGWGITMVQNYCWQMRFSISQSKINPVFSWITTKVHRWLIIHCLCTYSFAVFFFFCRSNLYFSGWSRLISFFRMFTLFFILRCSFFDWLQQEFSNCLCEGPPYGNIKDEKKDCLNKIKIKNIYSKAKQ